MTPSARAEIVVDTGAIRHNVRRLRELVSTDRPADSPTDSPTGRPVQMIAVVKADGYGHGMVEAGRAARAGGAEWLAAATPEEAVALRDAGDTGRLLCWLTVPGDDLAPAIEREIDVTAYSVAELEQVTAAVRRSRPARLQLKVDTGLSRGGAPREEWEALFAHAAAGERQGLWRVTGVWSHLASSDDPAHPSNDRQEQVFRDALVAVERAGLRPEVRHLANSAAAVLRPSARFDAVRCGIAIYGLDPAPGFTGDLGLVPAMTVRARLAMVKRLGAGEGVSYGHTWTTDRPTTVGLVPAGYGDGVPRHASNVAEVAVAGVRRPVRGRICMDQFLVDLGDDDAAAGDEVVLFGRGGAGEPTAQDWAEACGTINYEIVTRIGGRMRRTHVDPEGEAT